MNQNKINEIIGFAYDWMCLYSYDKNCFEKHFDYLSKYIKDFEGKRAWKIDLNNIEEVISAIENNNSFEVKNRKLYSFFNINDDFNKSINSISKGEDVDIYITSKIKGKGFHLSDFINDLYENIILIESNESQEKIYELKNNYINENEIFFLDEINKINIDKIFSCLEEFDGFRSPSNDFDEYTEIIDVAGFLRHCKEYNTLNLEIC